MIRALVTGAAGGLGRTVAETLTRRGCRVAGADIAPIELPDFAHRITADLTAPGAAAQVVTEAIRALGGLEVVVNNAAFGVAEAFADMREETWDRTLALNVKALALICAAAGTHMKQSRTGRIVNITSPASRMALPNYLAYAASKAGVDAITRAAAVALAPFGVLVNSVAPGMMDTPMQRITEAQLAAIDGRPDIDAYLAERTQRIPLGRRVEISVVADAVVWLALDAPDYLTAERLNRQRRPGQGLRRWRSATHRSTQRPSTSFWPAPTPSAGTCSHMARRIGQGYIGQGLGIADCWPHYTSTSCATTRPTPAGPAATASCSPPATIRSPSGRRSPRPAYSRSMSSRPTAPTAAGSTCRARHDAGRRDHRRFARPRAWPGRRHGARPAPAPHPDARVFVELSRRRDAGGRDLGGGDGRRGHFRLDNLVALIDCNGIQADGAVVLDIEPVADKWRAFGWDTVEIDGNDMHAGRRRAARRAQPQPAPEGDRAAHAARLRRADAGCRARKRISFGSSPTSGTHWPGAGEPPWLRRAARGRWGKTEAARAAPTGRRRSAMRWPHSATNAPRSSALTADLGKYTDIRAVPRRVPGPVLQCRHGRAEPDRDLRRPGPHRARCRSAQPTACSRPGAPMISSRSPARIAGST